MRLRAQFYTNYPPLLDKPRLQGGFYLTIAADMTALMYQCIVVFLLFSCSVAKIEIPLYVDNIKKGIKREHHFVIKYLATKLIQTKEGVLYG